MHRFTQVLVAGMISIMPPVVSQVHAEQPTKLEDNNISISATITKDTTDASAYLCVIEVSDLSTGKLLEKAQIRALSGKLASFFASKDQNSVNFEILVAKDGTKTSVKFINTKNGKIINVNTISIPI